MKKITLVIFLLLVTYFSHSITRNAINMMLATKQFNGNRALAYSAIQVNFGPRIYNSYAHDREINWITSELLQNNWIIKVDSGFYNARHIINIIGKTSPTPPDIIIGTHYDSRMIANRDPDISKQSFPVPGANDGASGVSVLLELSRIIDRSGLSIWLVFFDAEDDGNIQNQEWIMGSRQFAENLENSPNAVIVVDMVGDRNLDIYQEMNSNKTLNDALWQQAAALGFSDKFIDSGKYSMLDDHIPFVEMGIPTALIIDFDYAYWHTTSDTLDKLSANSLKTVGSTINSWINNLYKNTSSK